MRRPLRVGYVVNFLRPGGAEREMLALAERLPRDRFAAEFIEFSGPGSDVPRAAAGTSWCGAWVLRTRRRESRGKVGAPRG